MNPFDKRSPSFAASSSSSLLPHPSVTRLQWISGCFSLFLGLSTLILFSVWIREFESGFGTSTSTGHFNLHPLGMILAFPVFLVHGVLSWRLYPIRSHSVLKALHVVSNLAASAFVAFGLWAVFTVHSSPHLVSVHSWIALATVGLMAIQLLAGIFFYLIPGIPTDWRVAALPYHAFLGQLTLICALLTITTGLTNFLALNARAIKFNSREMTIGNSVGILVLATLLFSLYTLLPRRNPEAESELGSEQRSSPVPEMAPGGSAFNRTPYAAGERY